MLRVDKTHRKTHVRRICANNHPDPDHSVVRWKANDLEAANVEDLAHLSLPTPLIDAWVRTALQAAVLDLTAYHRRQAKALAKRKSELAAMQDCLLNAYLAGTVDKDLACGLLAGWSVANSKTMVV